MTNAYLTNKLAFRMRPKSTPADIVTLSGEEGLVPFTIPRTSPNRVIPSQTSGMRRQKTGRTDSTWSVTCDWNEDTNVIAKHIDDVWEFQWRPAGPDFPMRPGLTRQRFPGTRTQACLKRLAKRLSPGLPPAPMTTAA